MTKNDKVKRLVARLSNDMHMLESLERDISDAESAKNALLCNDSDKEYCSVVRFVVHTGEDGEDFRHSYFVNVPFEYLTKEQIDTIVGIIDSAVARSNDKMKCLEDAYDGKFDSPAENAKMLDEIDRGGMSTTE